MKRGEPPDDATRRAVEILAALAERNRSVAFDPPPPHSEPIVLWHPQRTMRVGVTTRAEIAADLGPGSSYPAPGWWTYAFRDSGMLRLLSVIFYADVLTGAEWYVPKSPSIPELAARTRGAFELRPVEAALGARLDVLDPRYTPSVGGPGRVTYRQCLEIRFSGGLAYVMGNGGVAERLALYAAPA